jgi:hypothetical protein
MNVSRYSAPSPARCQIDPHYDRRDGQGSLAATTDLASAMTDLDVVIQTRLLMNNEPRTHESEDDRASA